MKNKVSELDNYDVYDLIYGYIQANTEEEPDPDFVLTVHDYNDDNIVFIITDRFEGSKQVILQIKENKK